MPWDRRAGKPFQRRMSEPAICSGRLPGAPGLSGTAFPSMTRRLVRIGAMPHKIARLLEKVWLVAQTLLLLADMEQWRRCSHSRLRSATVHVAAAARAPLLAHGLVALTDGKSNMGTGFPKTVLAVRDHNLRVAMGRMFAELRKLARAEEQHQLRDFCDWIRANAPEHMHGQFVIGVANEPLECRRGYSWPSNLAR